MYFRFTLKTFNVNSKVIKKSIIIYNQCFGSGSGSGSGIRRIRYFFSDPDPDPLKNYGSGSGIRIRYIINNGSGSGSYKLSSFFDQKQLLDNLPYDLICFLKNSGQFRYISAFTRVFMLPVTLIEVLAIAVSIVMVVKAKNSLFSYLLPF